MDAKIGRKSDDYEAMATELRHMNIPQDIINARLHQMKKFKHLVTCVHGANIILNFAAEYGLTGNFKNIKTIASHGEQDLQMKSFDEKLMDTCKILGDLTKEDAECLAAFVKCSPLIKWLKESVHATGLKELKVFVDLAFISAGDEPINQKRVECLNSAVTDYAPLIFDIKPSADYTDLLDKCRLVWGKLKANPALPKQLIDTNRQLQWLNDIKMAHGSVEATALNQADTINTCGIYTIGKGAWKQAETEKMGELVSVLQLTVSETVEGHTERKIRNYKFSQLQDLQSRLMLVAGKAEKGNGAVETFTSVFDSIVRLSNVYLQLCSAGCVLFNAWTARFLCDVKKPVCVELEFGYSENTPYLKGRRSEHEDLKDVVRRLANFMEDCYESWLQHIHKKRREYQHLNFYTVDQLVILQREIVKCGTGEDPTELIYPILSAVKPDCTPDDLVIAIEEAKVELERVEMEGQDIDLHGDNDDKEDEYVTRKEAFIEEIVGAGYTEDLAEKAADHVDDFDVDAGIIWCMDRTEEEDNPHSEYGRGAGKRETVFSCLKPSTQDSIQNLIDNNIRSISRNQSGDGFEPLRKALDALWEEFLGSVSSSVRDYLSLEHLGLILRCLAKQNEFCVNRNLPPDYHEGEPNLLICPTGDVLPTALAIFMMTKDQPLPQPDEVLVCTSQTTVDEVDIFWKRGLFGDTRKIHCLVNVDLLVYNVSDAAERNLEEYLQSGNAEHNFKLVVLSGSDNDNPSRIVSALDKFRRAVPYVDLQGIREYLEVKLRVKDQLDGMIKPAASVDFSNSSVRLVKSWRAGVGKTLYKTRTQETLEMRYPDEAEECVSIPIQEKQVDVNQVTQRLLQHMPLPGQHPPKIVHIDIAHEVEFGVDYLLFNLLVLGSVTDKKGYMWRRSWAQLYLIETMPLMVQPDLQNERDMQYAHRMLSILPDVTCRSPQESQDVYMKSPPKGYQEHDQLFDEEKFKSPDFQRPIQWLMRHDSGQHLDAVDANIVAGDTKTCLKTLLRHCGVQDPSWAELHHFVCFLNTQLKDYETNDFVKFFEKDLPGFPKFVLRFLINMSRDFSTRSLNISEQTPGALYELQQLQTQQMQQHQADNDNDDLEQYQMRRTWESSPHPYLFINYDTSFTFLGFNIDPVTGNMIDQNNGQILEKAIMDKRLYRTLKENNVPIQENFDVLPRDEMIQRLRSVMRRDDKSQLFTHDPDDTYELTTDNVKKILAIFMRFRCDIPVIIMGETGCGKTRLIKFMCSLQLPPDSETTNMILMKVHGGTTHDDIRKKVETAETTAKYNMDKFGRNVFTVLFFDEANTTDAIGLIKEVLCDKSIHGRKLSICENLKIVAACNPYRKHSDDLIKKLEQSGLGYHVDADATCDRLGRVPMRRLVYRVQPLPQSLLPMVWDFGQLDTNVEDLYIRQMVRRHVRNEDLPGNQPKFVEVVSSILTTSQEYMRKQKDECSFVSLRDVDRVLDVMSWFYRNSQENRILFNRMERKTYDDIDDVTRSLVLALGVCYHACLRNRQEYRRCVAKKFEAPYVLPEGARTIESVIVCCQDVYLDSVQLEKNIARNMALKENVFMMTVCIELRIPLFLVGKPGSSKSLSKTIVSDAMQGSASRDELFKDLKQAQMVSFQCSPLATPDGIVGTFRQCAQFQKDKDLTTFVSIVVLDEVGLAEDSPRMPLKTLHPLLEDGCQGEEKPEPFKKVAFIGISNWALDPAKMNRGILVQRDVPDLEEIEKSARGICTTDTNEDLLHRITPLIEPMAISYLEIFEKASKERREFYGLRDFYSLVKMVYAFMERSGQDPTWHEIKHAVLRNFGGLKEVDPVNSFKTSLSKIKHFDDEEQPGDPDCSQKGLIEACLFNTINMNIESRYLLLLTENYGALNILQQEILAHNSKIRPITIFGSSFRSDQTYTQVCRNINKIKVCMETGKTVVLLNLENLYESLYDALNQYYVEFGGERYVDLGLGTHRVKCPVHRNFRLIVIAEKQTVYDKFPIPLINRLEKHFLTLENILSLEQIDIVNQLKAWAQKFVTQNNNTRRHGRPEKSEKFRIADVFMGYHDDTCSAIVVHEWPKHEHHPEGTVQREVLRNAQERLLWCATPDAVVRLSKSDLCGDDKVRMKSIYNKEQAHDSLSQYLRQAIKQRAVMEGRKGLCVQVTTHSKLLPSSHIEDLSNATDIPVRQIMLLDTLSSFDTEQQFSNTIHQFLKQLGGGAGMILVQCDAGDRSGGLVACARYCVMDEIESMRESLRAAIHVVFIIQLPRIAAGCFTGFQCGVWHSVHIDDLRPADTDLPTVYSMEEMSVGTLLQIAVDFPQEFNSTDGAENMSSSQRNQSHLVSHGNTLDVYKLILACVHSALSMVKDREDISRTTERVHLVLKLFCQNTGPKLVHGVAILIAFLLKDKENFVFTEKKWLTEEAANPDNIQKTGTFRRSCMQTLESKISPILAGVIAYLDTNQNLDILNAAHWTWKQTLWLDLLHTPKAFPLKYSDLQSPQRKSDLPEVIVQTTGCDGRMFKGQMPFSWLIYEQIDEVLEKKTLPLEDEGNDSLAKKIGMYAGLLHESSFGCLLDRILDTDEINDATEAYVSDFLHMVYRATTDQEHMLVCKSIICAADQILKMVHEDEKLHNEKGQTGTLLSHLVCVHIAYIRMEQRLVYFQTMNQVWPECSKEIIAYKQNNPASDMFKEEELTFSGLWLLIDDLNPDKKSSQKEGKSTGKSHGKEPALNDPVRRSQWLQKVYKYRHVIENVIRLHTENPLRYSSNSQTVKSARCLWNRVVVVKLFLEHVCASKDKDAITVKHCKPFWIILREKTDLKEVASLDNIERFLKQCNKVAIKEFQGKQEKCSHCESVLDVPPIVLPCRHIVCHDCLHAMRDTGDNTCHNCKTKVDEHWKPGSQMENNKAIQQLEDYQKRCNSFFMDVVSQLCFADNTSPSEAVIDKLLNYVLVVRGNAETGTSVTTKEMGIFQTGIDPNPVFRSYLLQLLMRSSKETVTVYLGKYLEDARKLIDGRDEDQKDTHLTCLSQLIIQCFENLLLEEWASDVASEITMGNRYLEAAMRVLDTNELSVDKLRGIAEARVGLAVTAKYMTETVKGEYMEDDVRRLAKTAQHLCTQLTTQMPWTYLVKYLCRHYGVELYQSVCKSQRDCLRWVTKSKERKECVDRYIVCGEVYKWIREALTRVIIGEDVQQLYDILKDLKYSRVNIDVPFHLAVYREVTCSNIYLPDKRKVTPKVLQKISDFVRDYDLLKTKDLAKALIHNQLGHRLCVQPDQSLLLHGIQCLTVHFMTAIEHIAGERTLIQPLTYLQKAPLRCQNAYLPTMPEDDVEEIIKVVLDGKTETDYNPVFYTCPNGHPFYFGNCGRPQQRDARCQCGMTIGAIAYNQPKEGVELYHETDQTANGHILGPAADRGDCPYPERNLSPLSCACVRLLIHLAMYAGSLNYPQEVEALIKPDIEDGSGPEFLWQHIVKDVEHIQHYTGRSPDDVLLLMHAVVNNMTTHGPGDIIKESTSNLSTKEGRDDWEKLFSSRFLMPVLQDIDATLQKCNEEVVKDHRLGADPLLCLLYETEVQQDPVHPDMLQDEPSVWRYRTPISLEHLKNMLKTTKNHNYKVLRHFLEEDHHLRALRYIPGIMKMHRMLLNKYDLRMDKEEALKMKIGDLKREEAGHEILDLIDDFARAWDLLREDLKKHICRTTHGNIVLSKEYCNRRITDEQPIAILLPTSKGIGICSYVILDFLMRKQNDFLAEYRRTTKSADPVKVVIRNITTADLISYDPNRDIMPLVLANCRYSFAMGSGTSIEYDFAGLERQLMDRFLFSKSEIKISGTINIDMMVYRAEVTNALVFKKLREKIPQNTLSGAVKLQISNEMRTLPDLCTALDNLDIAISFLSSVGGKPTQNLYEFMADTLKMENALISQKARQECQVQHSQSLWLHLSLLKSKQIADHKQPRQNIFDNIEDKYHECLSPEQLAAFRDYIKPLSVDKLSQLVEVLHEYIVLVVSVRDNIADEDYVDKAEKELYGWLYGYLEDMDRPTDDLIEFPREILICQSSHTWTEAYGMLKEKKNGHRN